MHSTVTGTGWAVYTASGMRVGVGLVWQQLQCVGGARAGGGGGRQHSALCDVVCLQLCPRIEEILNGRSKQVTFSTVVLASEKAKFDSSSTENPYRHSSVDEQGGDGVSPKSGSS